MGRKNKEYLCDKINKKADKIKLLGLGVGTPGEESDSGRGRLRQAAARCGRLWQAVEAVAGCGRLWQAVAGCGRLWQAAAGCCELLQ